MGVIEPALMQYGYLGILTILGVLALRGLWAWVTGVYWPHHVIVVQNKEKRQDLLVAAVTELRDSFNQLSQQMASNSEMTLKGLHKLMEHFQVNRKNDDRLAA